LVTIKTAQLEWNKEFPCRNREIPYLLTCSVYSVLRFLLVEAVSMCLTGTVLERCSRRSVWKDTWFRHSSIENRSLGSNFNVCWKENSLVGLVFCFGFMQFQHCLGYITVVSSSNQHSSPVLGSGINSTRLFTLFLFEFMQFSHYFQRLSHGSVHLASLPGFTSPSLFALRGTVQSFTWLRKMCMTFEPDLTLVQSKKKNIAWVDVLQNQKLNSIRYCHSRGQILHNMWQMGKGYNNFNCRRNELINFLIS